MTDKQPGVGGDPSEPNPFSRPDPTGPQGSSAIDGPQPPASEPPAADPAADLPAADPAAGEAWPGYPPGSPAPEPHPPVGTTGYGPGQPDPGYDPVPTAPYGPGAGSPAPGQGYGPPTQGYGPPTQGYGPPTQGYGPPDPGYNQPQPYGANPYGPVADPYQPSYGGYSPYGVVPVQHPRVTAALVCGITALVFGLSCGLGGLMGIPAIIIGRRARREIDADPQRYTGRGLASAGFGLGIAGLVVLVGYVVLFTALGLSGNLD